MTAKQPWSKDSGFLKGFLRPCLLLLLGEGPAHGYDLMERLKAFDADPSNPSMVYRALRHLEESSLVCPRWETSGPGPARRVYQLTPAGRRALEGSAARADHWMELLRGYLVRCRELQLRSGSQEGRSFEVLVEATVSVDAPDEAAARKKVEDAFAEPRRLDVGVWSKGPAWAYNGVVDAVR